jgi:hypothetical protein
MYKGTKYFINDKYFDIIDSYEKAYFLGFIAADGCIHIRPKKSYRLIIKLQAKDVEILKYIKHALSYNGPIRHQTKPFNGKMYDQVVLEIGNKYLIQSLVNLGITPRKSHTLLYPFIDESYNSSFIRGIFDGDGCLSVSMCNNNPSYTVTIAGSENIIDKINEFSPIKGSKSFRDGIYLFRIYGNLHIIKFMNWLYGIEGFKLNRKYNKYLELKSLYPNGKPQFWLRGPHVADIQKP